MTPDAREWLETDGLGGYAMGGADGVRTRRYHGLLVAATRPPAGRMVLVNDLEVFAETARGRVALSSHRYRGPVVHPDGAVRLAAFRGEPWPTWEFALEGGARVAQEIWCAARPA
jgi:glycogen debranching enzyme